MSLFQAESYRTFLNNELARRIRSNPRYSQRAFARQLGLSPGELSEVLRGKRALSFKSAMKISQTLGFNPTETRQLLQLIEIEKGQSTGNGELLVADTHRLKAHGQQVTLDMFHAVSDWYCFAILNLADTQGFRWDSNWISKRLGITRTEVRIALDRLERVGLLEREEGKLRVAKDFVFTTSGIPSEAIRNCHRQILKKAIDALDTQSVRDREISGIGFAIDPKHLDAIKREISEFQDQLLARFGRGKKTEVYQLEFALFRLTEGEKNEI